MTIDINGGIQISGLKNATKLKYDYIDNLAKIDIQPGYVSEMGLGDFKLN